MKRILCLYALLLSLPLGAVQICREPSPHRSAESPRKTAPAKKTGARETLQWQHCAVGLFGPDCDKGELKRLNFMQAKDFVFQTNREGLEGHHDWRLPTMAELESIKSPDCVNPAIDLKRFPNTPPIWFWSSRADNEADVWYLDFQSGFSDQDDRNLPNAVRLVRTVGKPARP